MKEDRIMKKIISLVLVCVMLVGCMFALSSCGAPNSDPAKAKAALEEAGYIADITDDPIEVIVYGAIGIEAIVSGVKVAEDDEDKLVDAVTIFYLKDEADVQKAYETLEPYYNKAVEQYEDLDMQMGKSGNMIWFGTKAAIKAAK